jgi:hypothetical protein
LAGLTLVVVLAVTQEWGWPLLGSTRAGIAVLFVVGMAMCMTGGSTMKEPSARGPFLATASVLGVAALVLVVVGLIAKSELALVLLAIDIGLLWIVSTLRHVVEGPRGALPHAPAH